jgi:DNA-binding protein HU-beta
VIEVISIILINSARKSWGIGMTKAELINEIAGEYKKKEVEAVLDAVFVAIKGTLTDEGSFSLPGFGTFKVKTRAGRKGRNPRTGEEIDIAESKTVSFKPAPSFKETL